MNENDNKRKLNQVSNIRQQNISESETVFNFIKSFCFKTLSSIVSYSAGLFDISPCWLVGILLLFKYRDRWRLQNKFKQQLAIGVSLRSDRKSIIVNINRPPSWVYFPEKENCEWLNKMLSNVWANISIHIENFIKHTMEQRINEALSKYKRNANFNFKSLRLGSTVPRICGIKVNKVEAREFEIITIDFRLFYTGDTEIYFYIMSVGGGIHNLGISGWMRIVLKILKEPTPLLGGVEIFFLHKPKVDFDFLGAMDILKIPGLSGMIRKTVDDQLSFYVVLPNKFTMKLNNIVDSGNWRCPDPEGLVRIHVVKAKDLRDTNSSFFGPATPDTNVIVSFGAQAVFSECFESSLNPEWDFWANFMIDSTFHETILINVNERSGNQSLGKVSIELALVQEKKFVRSWVQLEDTTTGMILLELFYYETGYEADDVQTVDKLLYVLIVFINTAFNLVNPHRNETPNSVVYLEFGKTTQVSKSVLSNNPVFEEVFLFIPRDSPKNIKLNLVDANTKTNLGNATLPIKRVFEANYMETIDQICPLMNTVTESSLSLSMRLRILKQ